MGACRRPNQTVVLIWKRLPFLAGNIEPPFVGPDGAPLSLTSWLVPPPPPEFRPLRVYRLPKAVGFVSVVSPLLTATTALVWQLPNGEATPSCDVYVVGFQVRDGRINDGLIA
eukprot:2389692-Prymnesium_polylepis.1